MIDFENLFNIQCTPWVQNYNFKKINLENYSIFNILLP